MGTEDDNDFSSFPVELQLLSPSNIKGTLWGQNKNWWNHPLGQNLPKDDAAVKMTNSVPKWFLRTKTFKSNLELSLGIMTSFNGLTKIFCKTWYSPVLFSAILLVVTIFHFIFHFLAASSDPREVAVNYENCKKSKFEKTDGNHVIKNYYCQICQCHV